MDIVERHDHTGAKPITIQLDPAEVLALYSFLALGEHFAATVSGELSPFSPDETRGHISMIAESASKTLMRKLAAAVKAVQTRARSGGADELCGEAHYVAVAVST